MAITTTPTMSIVDAPPPKGRGPVTAPLLDAVIAADGQWVKYGPTYTALMTSIKAKAAKRGVTIEVTSRQTNGVANVVDIYARLITNP